MTAVTLNNNLITNRQAQPRTFSYRFSCKEGVKYSFLDSFGNAGAIVCNPNYHSILVLKFGANPNLPILDFRFLILDCVFLCAALVFWLIQSINSIAEDIHKYLVKLARVALYWR